jgi:hypothetical protein
MQLEEYAQIIAQMIDKLEPLHVLDYGCGADLALAKALRENGLTHSFKYQAYDPDVPRFAKQPFPADVVVCLHLGSDEALDDLRRLTEGVGFFVVSGDKHEWLPRIMARFDLQTYQATGQEEFYAVVYAKPRAIENEAGEKLT